MKIVIVTGMSGSGKTVALKMFEDFGYYCVDNLPLELLLDFVELTIESERGKNGVALGIDIRSGLNGLQEVFDKLDHKKINMEILFLEADDETLIKRYKETRRNHPLAAEGRLIDGINLERQKLAFLRDRADRILDTGRFLTKELKQELKKSMWTVSHLIIFLLRCSHLDICTEYRRIRIFYSMLDFCQTLSMIKTLD